ncbi:hypothetical protein C4D60_Mb05t02060 [Musa balbisiana]|uniref:Uncharacterized protein n=1 Tax=Musa balbisiana TaxID=52838 RepID=A0A4S8JT21_MUSBA|nr:hypothetical protein C4D60_Mb05t02060 [Musa balbisiana]
MLFSDVNVYGKVTTALKTTMTCVIGMEEAEAEAGAGVGVVAAAMMNDENHLSQTAGEAKTSYHPSQVAAGVSLWVVTAAEFCYRLEEVGKHSKTSVETMTKTNCSS